MAATPAWPPQSTPRLYVPGPLAEGVTSTVEGAQAHYLGTVMRSRIGDPVKLFDGASGEWLARVADVARRSVTLSIEGQLRPPETVPDLWLLAAPLKKGRIDWLVEKACELGAARVRLVATRRAVVDRVNLDRLAAHMVEAAEQCGRTAVPALDDLVPLATLLRDWPAGRALFFADETGGAPALATMAAHRGPAAILIGPEGGFDPAERDAVRALADTRAISLGPRILRADTAAAAALALWMAAADDWSASS